MKVKDLLTLICVFSVIFVFSVLCWFAPKETYSKSERRALAEFPDASLESIISGEFAEKFETYAVDVFPLRDGWRSIKAYTRLYAFLQSDNNGIYKRDGYLSKIEYPENRAMQDYALSLFNKVYEKYLVDNKVYFSMIPDKNMFLSSLSMDYSAFFDYMSKGMPYSEPIDIMSLLSAEDYYFTDTHWRQERIFDVAKKIAYGMGTAIPDEYTVKDVDTPFFGVYAGQSALNVEPDNMKYLTNTVIEGYRVEGGEVYDMSKLSGNDPYEMYLSGNQPVVKIINEKVSKDKRLVVFRDSFGSSIGPLIAQGYYETTFVDLRYIASDYLESYVSFQGADVLFLYSTLILNSSLGMK